MNTRELQDELSLEIDMLGQLRDKLSDDGEPMSGEDKKAVRHVLAGRWLERMQQEMRYFFREGHSDNLRHSGTYISETLDSFS